MLYSADQLRAMLADRRTSVVARSCSISPRTIQRFLAGRTISVATLAALSEYVRATPHPSPESE